MTSKTGKQIIVIHILPNILRSKGNQAIKFGQLVEYDSRTIFLKNRAENEAKILVLDLFLLFQKTLYKMKTNGQHQILIYPGRTQLEHTIKMNS